MDLFGVQPGLNLLPCDGTVNYYGVVFGSGESALYQQRLMKTIEWKHDETVMFGKRIVTARKVAWVADQGISYAYSGTTKSATKWSEELLELRRQAERLSGESFNSCLLNLYHHGGEGMGWHSDNEKSIVAGSAIASFSFGAERKFSFRHKTSGESISLLLENGSLLVMKGETQKCWQHQVPKTKKVIEPRINLTFRRMRETQP